MRRVFVCLFILNSIVLLFADGGQERDRQAYEQIQLKIVNLTNKAIYFYFNKLYFPTVVKSQEEYITMNTPVNKDYPGFIGIKYSMRDIIVYSFRYRISERIFRVDRQYIVLIMESDIYFIEGNIEAEYDYFDESLYQKFPELDWHKEVIGENDIYINMINNSSTTKEFNIYSVLGERYAVQLRINENDSYIIDDRLFALGGMEILILDGGFFERIILENNTRKYDKNNIYSEYKKYYNINLRIYDDGYEISYN